MRIRKFRRDILAATLVTLSVVALVSFGPLPKNTRISAESHDFAHVVVFAILGVVLSRTLRRMPARRPDWSRVALVTLAAGFVFGVVTELAQQWIGGILSWGDIARDVLGAALGTCSAIGLERLTSLGARRLAWTAVALGFAGSFLPLGHTLLAYRARDARFPTLLEPGAPHAQLFLGEVADGPYLEPLPDPWQASDASAGAPAPDGEPERALRIPLDRGRYPGIQLSEVVPDWRGWSSLLVDLVNPGDEPLRLALRVHDGAHDNRFEDRYNTTLELPPRTRRQFSLPLADIERAPTGRRMDMTQIDKIILFHVGPAPGRSVYVRRLALAR